MELYHEDEAPASSNNKVYEEVTPQETLNSGMDDQKMESKTTSTIEQALECNGEGGKRTYYRPAYEAATAL